MRDEIFSNPIASSFEFNDEVARVFDDMLERSIPAYSANASLIAKICLENLSPAKRIYDLGCSTGNFLALLLDSKASLIGVDNSQAMIDKAKAKFKNSQNIEFINADFLELELKSASAIVMNYTLQFVRPLHRLKLLKSIHSALEAGGMLFLSEKVVLQNARLNKQFIDLYYTFKRQNGYSNLEIAHKREALENVLIPYTIDENIALLKEAGFSEVEILSKNLNFTTFVAIK